MLIDTSESKLLDLSQMHQHARPFRTMGLDRALPEVRVYRSPLLPAPPEEPLLKADQAAPAKAKRV